jgi:hypothetical protein
VHESRTVNRATGFWVQWEPPFQRGFGAPPFHVRATDRPSPPLSLLATRPIHHHTNHRHHGELGPHAVDSACCCLAAGQPSAALYAALRLTGRAGRAALHIGSACACVGALMVAPSQPPATTHILPSSNTFPSPGRRLGATREQRSEPLACRAPGRAAVDRRASAAGARPCPSAPSAGDYLCDDQA